MSLTEKTNIVTEGQGLLLSQFQDSPNLKNFLGLFLDVYQGLEADLFDVKEGFDVDTAVGAQLDVLGAIVGIDRGGRTDSAYRPLVKARILINSSSGLYEEIIQFTKLLVGSAFTTTFTEQFPKGLEIQINGASAPVSSTDITLLAEMIEAGTRAVLKYQSFAGTTFQLGTTGRGFGQGNKFVDEADLAAERS